MATKPKKAIATKRTRVTAKRSLLLDIRHLIEEARAAVAVTVNAGLTMLYWQIGERINAEILKGSRAEYGKQIVATLSQELSEGYGQGFILFGAYPHPLAVSNSVAVRRKFSPLTKPESVL